MSAAPNTKKGRFMNMQVSILLNPSDLDERLHEGMAMSTPEFVSSTLLRLCDPDRSSWGSDFSNLCAVMKSLPSTARTYVRLVADSPDNNCFCLLVSVVESWIHDMLETNLMIVITRSSNLKSFIPTKYVVSCQVVAEKIWPH